MKILAGQMARFADEGERRFVQTAMEHVRRFFPEESAGQGDEALRETVATALFRARSYGIETRYDLLRFINHVYALGERFDADPGFPWAGEILNRRDVPARLRMDALGRRTRKELSRASGG